MRSYYKLVCLILASVILFGSFSSVTVLAGDSSDFDDTSYRNGQIIKLGYYPQTQVSSDTLIKKLNSLGGTWTSYKINKPSNEYEFSTVIQNNMYYKDVEYRGNKYRAVRIDEFTEYSMNHGYSIGIVYWFRYEPIEWYVIDAERGIVVSNKVLDAFVIRDGKSLYKDGFYNSAFTANEQSTINETYQDNLDYNGKSLGAPYYAKVYPSPVVSSQNSPSYIADRYRNTKPTSYAKVMGVSGYGDGCAFAKYFLIGKAGQNDLAWGSPAPAASGFRPEMSIDFYAYNNADLQYPIYNQQVVNGQIIKLGSYPQTQISSGTLIAELNSLDGVWSSYKINKPSGEFGEISSEIQNNMYYKDVEYRGNKYRAVRIDAFTEYSSKNDYNIGTVYWFKYEPIEWYVIDAERGAVVSNKVLDAFVIRDGKSLYNGGFCNSAFTAYEQSKINETYRENVDYYGQSLGSPYYAKVYTSITTAKSTSPLYIEDRYRNTKPTSYAKVMGVSGYGDGYAKYYLIGKAGHQNDLSWGSPAPTASGFRPEMSIDFYALYCSHSFGEWIVDENATCQAEGAKHRICELCDCQEVAVVSKTSHTFGDWVIDVPATTVSVGSKHRVCSVCSHTETEEIPMLEEVSLLRFELNANGTAYTVVGCDESATGEIIVPATHKGLPVTRIGANAFFEREWITSVVLPESIYSIGDHAFSDCVRLVTVNIPDTVRLIDWGAFLNCKKLSSINIPEGVIGIGEWTFGYCGLTSVTIPSTVVDIEVSAFQNCTKLTEVTIPANVKEIGYGAFTDCAALKTVVLENGVEVIGGNAFINCGKLESVTLPESVTTIGERAFFGCTSLNDILIPRSVTSMGDDMFKNDTSIVVRCYCNSYALYYVTNNEINYSVIHDFSDEWTVDKVATCIESGLKSHHCTVCGEKKDITIIDKLGHCISDWSIVTEATCTVEGEKQGICENCGMVTEIIPALGHAFSNEWTVDIAATCNIAGSKSHHCLRCSEKSDVTEIMATGHNMQVFAAEISATCTEDGRTTLYKCAGCDATEGGETIPAKGHKMVAIADEVPATCTANGKTAVYFCAHGCGYTEGGEVIPAISHVFGDWIMDYSPNCTTDGTKHRICQECKCREDETITKLGHDYSNEWTIDTPATCSAEGSKSHHCSRCGEVKDVTAIEKTNHLLSEWTTVTEATCELNGISQRSCSGCSYFEEETIPAIGHKFSQYVWTTDKTPTCTVAGSKSHHCLRPGCAAKQDVTEIAPLGHAFAEWEDLEVASCTVDGLRYHYCTVCYTEEVETLTAPGHKFGDWIVDSEGSCTENGSRHHICSVCKVNVSETVIAPGHDYSTVWTIDEEANCVDSGVKSHHCSRCNDRKDVTVIEPLGHQFSKLWAVDVPATCTTVGSKSHHCLRCDERTDITEMSISGHIFDAWYVEIAATMDSTGVIAHDCINCDFTETRETPKLQKHTVTFKADGDVVARVDFPLGATSIDEPEVPAKDKYTGVWSDYVLGDADITVNAIYTPIESENINDISSDNSGKYANGVVNVNIHTASPSRTVVTSSSTPVPLDVVLVLDQSGSMAGAKKTALVNAVTQFSNTVLNDAKEKAVEHRLAIVGFGMGQDSYGTKGRSGYIPAYGNTEILTAGKNPVAYNAANAETYANALVSANANGSLNSVITKAIGSIDAEGATRADLGLEMAAKIFSNNEADGRQRVVVFFTDGEPTSSSGFEYSVANAAIQNAYQIKDTYKANIYSVGIFDKAIASDTTVQTFMDAVSSNKLAEVKLNSGTRYPAVSAGGFNITVNDTENLSAIFTSIAEEAVIHTGLFDNLTIVETISNAFSLTTAQENALRLAAKEKLGVDNGDVIITRNANGTTRIEIKNIHPVLVNEEYVADISFAVTANENTLYSGTYTVNTLDSGVKVDGGENYEAVFAPMKVNVDGTGGIAVFNVNGVPYEIDRLSASEYVMAPAVDFDENYTFSGWDIPANCKLNNKAQIFDSTLTDNEYTVTWNINGEIISETYGAGDVITVPDVNADEVGGDFTGWDGEIPETMPDEDLVFTAVYNGAHYHKYEVTKNFTSCTVGGTLVYTCECGDSYTETIEPYEHAWVANTGAASEENSATVGFRCSVCGAECDNSLEYIRVNKEQAPNGNGTATYEFDFVNEDGSKEQPDGDVTINIPLDECFDNEVPDTSAGKAYRDNGNGSWSSVYAWFNGMNAQITTNHFSTYIFDFSETDKHIFPAVGAGTDIDFDSGCIFSQKRSVNTLATIISCLLPWNIEAEKDGKFFGTGSTVTLKNDGEEENYTVIINGDVDGDGVCDVLDVVVTELIVSQHRTATTFEAYAANGFADTDVSAEAYSAVVNAALAG